MGPSSTPGKSYCAIAGLRSEHIAWCCFSARTELAAVTEELAQLSLGVYSQLSPPICATSLRMSRGLVPCTQAPSPWRLLLMRVPPSEAMQEQSSQHGILVRERLKSALKPNLTGLNCSSTWSRQKGKFNMDVSGRFQKS